MIDIEQANNDLMSASAFVAERIRSADGHAEAISNVARRFALKGELDLAASLADTISDPHTRDTVLSEIAVICVDFDDTEYGLQLVEAIEEQGLQQYALSQIAIQQAKRGDISGALQIASTVEDAAMIYGSIAINLSANDETQAREIAERIEFPLIRTQFFNELSAQKIKQNNFAEAQEILTESLNEADNLEFLEEKTQVLLEIASRLLDANDVNKAFITLDEAQQIAEKLERRFRDQAFAQIALLYAHGKDFTRAELTLKPIEDLQQTATAHAAIALEHFKNGETDKAGASLEESHAVLRSQSERKIIDSQSRYSLLATIAVRFARFGKPERGLEIALNNPVEDSRNYALTNIAAICAENNNETISRQAINSLEDLAARVFALIAVSDVENKNADAEKSSKTLDEANALTEEIAQLPLRSASLNQIATGFYERGEFEKVAEILTKSLQIIQSILDDVEKSVALANLAENYQKLNIEISDVERNILHSIVRRAS